MGRHREAAGVVDLNVAGLVRAAGLDDVPLTVAARGDGGPLEYVQGHWPDGSAVVTHDRFYGASLSKQLTGAAVALLVRDGALDLDAPLSARFEDLPAWADDVSVRMLLHHTGGFPDAAAEPSLTGHLTNAWAMSQLQALDHLPFPPGAAYRYSNLGYICLAEIVASVAGESFPAFVERRIIAPLGLDGMGFWPQESTPPFPQVSMLGDKLPLSVGDGGLWTTAAAYRRWLDSQNHDALGITSLTDRPGRLSDGTPVDYGWGIGLRQFRGAPFLIHGGSWRGASAKAVRSPALSLVAVALAATDEADRITSLVDNLTAALADGLTASGA